jgi:hypothetical protein
VRAATEARKMDAKPSAPPRRTRSSTTPSRCARPCGRGPVYNFGGKDNTFEQAMLDQPPFRRQTRDRVSSIQALMQTALKIAEHDR